MNVNPTCFEMTSWNCVSREQALVRIFSKSHGGDRLYQNPVLVLFCGMMMHSTVSSRFEVGSCYSRPIMA
jgi:hypothetical protein